MKYISHIYQDQAGHWIIQSNEAHTAGVAKLSSQFAAEFGMGAWGKVLGQFHDRGKETNAFQQHIKKDSGFAPETKVVGDYHHAYIGAIIARNLYGKTADNFFIGNKAYLFAIKDICRYLKQQKAQGKRIFYSRLLPKTTSGNAEKIWKEITELPLSIATCLNLNNYNYEKTLA